VIGIANRSKSWSSNPRSCQPTRSSPRKSTPAPGPRVSAFHAIGACDRLVRRQAESTRIQPQSANGDAVVWARWRGAQKGNVNCVGSEFEVLTGLGQNAVHADFTIVIS
jgi:hypothetical protein